MASDEGLGEQCIRPEGNEKGDVYPLAGKAASVNRYGSPFVTFVAFCSILGLLAFTCDNGGLHGLFKGTIGRTICDGPRRIMIDRIDGDLRLSIVVERLPPVLGLISNLGKLLLETSTPNAHAPSRKMFDVG